jgi:hypothetical protein
MRVVLVPPRAGRVAAWAPGARLAGLVAMCMALGGAGAGGLVVPIALAGHLGVEAVAQAMAAILPLLLLSTAILAACAYLLLLGDSEGGGPVARHSAVLAAVSAMVCRQLALPAVLAAHGSAFAPAHAAAVALYGLSLAALGVGLIALTAEPGRAPGRMR